MSNNADIPLPSGRGRIGVCPSSAGDCEPAEIVGAMNAAKEKRPG